MQYRHRVVAGVAGKIPLCNWVGEGDSPSGPGDGWSRDTNSCAGQRHSASNTGVSVGRKHDNAHSSYGEKSGQINTVFTLLSQ